MWRRMYLSAFCETTRMANHKRAHIGAVAVNQYHPAFRMGTRLKLADSPYGPMTVVVSDVGPGVIDLDIAMPGQCDAAKRWGRPTVLVQVVR